MTKTENRLWDKIDRLAAELRESQRRLTLAKTTLTAYRALVRQHVAKHPGEEIPVVGCPVCSAVLRQAWNRR